MSTLRLCLTLLLACAVTFAAIPADDKVEDKAIRATVSNYFEAYSKQDLAALDACLAKTFSTPQIPDREAFLKQMKTVFARLAPSKYEAKVKSIRRDPGGKVVARVEFTAKVRLKGSTEEVDDEGQWAMSLIQEGGTWKLTRIGQAYADVFAAVVRAQTKAERLAILRAEEDDFLSLELIGKLSKEQTEFLEAGKFPTAEMIQEVMELAAEAIQDDKERQIWQGQCMLSRGQSELLQARYEKAIETFEAARVFFRKHEWYTLEVSALSSLVSARIYLGDYRGAIEAGETARKAIGEFNPLARRMVEAILLGNLGLVYLHVGDNAKAKKDLDESLRLAEKFGDLTTAHNARINLALLHQLQGHDAEAIKVYREAITVARKAGQRRAEGALMNNMALALTEQGQIGEALKLFEDARKLAVAVKDARGEANALGNIALVHFRLHTTEDTERYLNEALAAYKAIGDKSGIARCLRMTGALHVSAGRKAEAEKAFAESLEMAKASGSKLAAAEVALFAGSQFELNGQPEKAAESLASAAKLYGELGDSLRAALARLRKSAIKQPNGKYLLDLDELQALKREVTRLDDPRLTAPYHDTLGRMHFYQNEWAEAVSEFRAAIKAAERRIEQVEDPQLRIAVGQAELRVNLYTHLAAALTAHGDTAGAFAASDLAKARALASLLERGRQSIKKGMTEKEQQDEAKFRQAVANAAGKSAAEMRFANSEPGKAESLKKELMKAEADYQQFSQDLFVTHPELRGLRGELPNVDLATLQKSVLSGEPDVAILSYAASWDRVLIAVITAGDKPDGPARVVVRTVMVDEKELGDAAESFWKACQNRKAGRPLSDELYKWLIEPVEKDIKGKKHLLIVPCHPILTVPFQALAADKDSPYLIEQFAVSYAPSVSALLEMRKRGDKVRGPGRADRLQVLALGGAKFTRDLEDLPESGPEAEAVAKTFGDRSRVLLGEKATRPEVLKVMPDARFLHFATHGEINPPRPLFSALAVTPTGENDDGRLYAHDVLNLNLTAEMVVLSACDSGRGKEYRGEGTVGLAWAFFVAGAPAVVVSQWKVSDVATADLMREFYARLRAGAEASKAEALRQASLKLLKENKTKHPMFWAPFVLIGDWRK